MAISTLSRRIEPVAWLSLICAVAMLAHDTVQVWAAQAAPAPVGMTVIATPPLALSPVSHDCPAAWKSTSISYLAPPPSAADFGDLE